MWKPQLREVQWLPQALLVRSRQSQGSSFCIFPPLRKLSFFKMFIMIHLEDCQVILFIVSSFLVKFFILIYSVDINFLSVFWTTKVSHLESFSLNLDIWITCGSVSTVCFFPFLDFGCMVLTLGIPHFFLLNARHCIGCKMLWSSREGLLC